MTARIGAIVRLLGSDKDGEALAALRKLGRLLRADGRDFHWLGDLLERHFAPAGAKPWQSIAAQCLQRGHGRLKNFEIEFLLSMSTWPREPSAKQAALLEQIAVRLRVEAA